MWMQTMRWTARSGDASGVRAAFVEDETGTRLIVDAEREDGHFVALRDVRATVRLPAGDLRDVLMSQSEPGRWEGPVNTSARGPYVVSFAGVAPDGTERRLVRGTYFAGRERPSATPDLTLLTHVADATGGRVLSPGESPFSRSRPRGYVEVSEWLMIAALAMFVLELAVGRGAEFRKIRLWFRSELLRARRVAIARTEESGP
jgi:hypothetical protein